MCDEVSFNLRYPVTKEVLVDVCLHEMMVEYIIYLENMSFCFFSKLMEAAKCTNESIKETSMFNSLIHYSSLVKSTSKKRLIVAAVEKCKLKLPMQRKYPIHMGHRQFQASKREVRQFPVLSPFFIWGKESRPSPQAVGERSCYQPA